MLFLILTSLKDVVYIHQLVTDIQAKLNQYYDADQEPVKLKKFDLVLTDDGFLRYRKYLMNGKQ